MRTDNLDVDIYRKIIFKKASNFIIWNYLFFNVATRKKKVVLGGGERILQPGQMVTTVEKLTDIVGGKCITTNMARNTMKVFKDNGLISIETSPTWGTLVTINNWQEVKNNIGRIMKK